MAPSLMVFPSNTVQNIRLYGFDDVDDHNDDDDDDHDEDNAKIFRRREKLSEDVKISSKATC